MLLQPKADGGGLAMTRPRLIFVSGKYTARTEAERRENVELATTVGHVLRQLGFEAIVPHVAVLPPLEPDPERAWKIAMKTCLVMLQRCDSLVLVPNWRDSRGARIERWFALKRGIPVFERVPDLLV